MTSEQFAYWLQGFFELTGTNKLSEKQVAVIKEHLQLVFTKVTAETVDDGEEPTFCTDVAARDEKSEPMYNGKLFTALTDDELTEAEAIILKQYPSLFEPMSDNDFRFLFSIAEEKRRRQENAAVPDAIRGLMAEWNALTPEEKAKRQDEMQAKWESHRVVPAKPKQYPQPRYSRPVAHDPRGCRKSLCSCNRRYC